MDKAYSKTGDAGGAGFTLVEMMIVVAIISILAAIAVPNYAQYKVKAINGAAQAFLMDISQREEQYFLDARTYATGATALADLGLTQPTDVSAYYQAPTITAVGTGFTVVMTPIAGGKMAGAGTYKGTMVISNSNPTASISN